MFKVIIWPLLLIVGLAYYDIHIGIRPCHGSLAVIFSCDLERQVFFTLVFLSLLIYSLVSFVWIKSSRDLGKISGWWFLGILGTSVLIVHLAFNYSPFFTLGVGFGTVWFSSLIRGFLF